MRPAKIIPGVDPKLLIKDAGKLLPDPIRRNFLRGAASLGRNVHDMDDVARPRGGLDQRAVRFLAAPGVISDHERSPVPLGKNHVVDDHFRLTAG